MAGAHERSSPAPTLSERLHARILPYYLLIDREGKLRFRGIQPADTVVAARIAQLLAE